MGISKLRGTRFICVLFILFMAEMAGATVNCLKADTATKSNAINLYMQAIPNAQITVCSAGSSGIPCSPLSTLVTSGGATQTNPFFADSNGDYQVCTNTPGAYEIQISGPGLTTFVMDQIPIGFATSGDVAIGGNLTAKSIDSRRMVDQFGSASDVCAALSAAQSNLPLLNGYPAGVLDLSGFAGSTIAACPNSPFIVNSPYVSVVGPGSTALQITCSINGDCIRINTNPFVITRAGTFSGFGIIGTGTVNGVGIHIGDIIWSKMIDIYSKNFTGTNGVCLLVDNEAGWTERSDWHVDTDNCTTNVEFEFNSPGTSSFGYNTFDFRLNMLGANQVGIYGKSGSVYHSFFSAHGNANNSSDTLLNLQSTSGWEQNFLAWGFECTGCSGNANGLVIGASSILDYAGIIDLYGFTNNISGTIHPSLTYATGFPFTFTGQAGSGDNLGTLNPSAGPGAWLLTNPGASGGFLFGVSDNLTWTNAGTWQLFSDGANNGGWGWLGNNGNGGQLCLFQVPNSGTPASTQTVVQANLNNYRTACFNDVGTGNGQLQITGITPLSLLPALGFNALTFTTPANYASAKNLNFQDPLANVNVGYTFNTGTGISQSKRAVSGCTTAGSIGGICASDITVTWGTAFADANYSVACTGSTPTNVPSAPYVVSGTKSAGSVHINYFAITAAAASYSTVDCEATHD